MIEFERRTIEELISLYECEPQLRDSFVEGVLDKDILAAAYGPTGSQSGEIYEIDAIEVPAEILQRHKLSNGNKQRVIALAIELSDKISSGRNYKCIVDPDLDKWLDETKNIDRLHYLSYCAIENYFLDRKVVYRVLVTAGKIKVRNYDGLYDSMCSVLRELFAIRLADSVLRWKMAWLNPEKCLVAQKDTIGFCVEDFIKKLLMANGRLKNMDDFTSTVYGCRLKLAGDQRNFVHGHDFVDLLVWTMRAFKGIREYQSETTIQRIFVLLSSDNADLKAEIALMP